MTTLDDIRGRATITVWPEAGQLLGLGRDSAYRAAERGELPTLKLGRRLLVPVPKLLRLLGLDLDARDEAAPVGKTGAVAMIKTPDAISNGQVHDNDPAG